MSDRSAQVQNVAGPFFISGKTVVVGHTPQRDGMVLDLGFLVGIDTDCCRAGWLTAFEDRTGGIVQADQSGAVHYSGRELKA